LKANGIQTMGDLSQHAMEDLSTIKGIGRKTRRQIKQALEDRDLLI